MSLNYGPGGVPSGSSGTVTVPGNLPVGGKYFSSDSVNSSSGVSSTCSLQFNGGSESDITECPEEEHCKYTLTPASKTVTILGNLPAGGKYLSSDSVNSFSGVVQLLL